MRGGQQAVLLVLPEDDQPLGVQLCSALISVVRFPVKESFGLAALGKQAGEQGEGAVGKDAQRTWNHPVAAVRVESAIAPVACEALVPPSPLSAMSACSAVTLHR